MNFNAKLKEVQTSLVEQEIKGWLLYDYRRNNPLAYQVLEIPLDTMVTRRFFYWIPQLGNPVKIVPLIESYTLDHLPGEKWSYRGWQDLERLLASIAKENSQIAMEYSTDNALPAISKVDAGTIEFMRKNGAEIISSANLLQKYTSVWTDKQYQSHKAAADFLSKTVDQTWAFIAEALKSKQNISEYQVQQFMLQRMQQNDCITDHAPICAVNAHSADPHYAPSEKESSSIRPGDFILLDLWCKQNHADAVYADIARVAVAAPKPSNHQEEIFQIVKGAREQTTDWIKERYETHQSIQGWQADQFCRDFIQKKGYDEFFIHRTGHNIGQDVHGPGANLDNFETHDFRFLLPGTCFSVEPGIYIPEQFGIRLEYDVFLHPSGKLEITGGVQEKIVCLDV